MVEELTWSHILPRWAYRRISQMGAPGQTVPVQVANGVAMLSSDQLADFLLCAKCEDKFQHWENYVARVSRNGDSFPALAAARAHPIPNGSVGDKLRMADVSELDVGTIVRFAVSVLWRAAACPALCPQVRLGPYRDEFSRFLRDEAPFPARAHVLLSLIDCDEVPQLSQHISPPSSWRHQGRHAYYFMVFGMAFEFYVGGNDRAAYDCGCLSRMSQAIVTNGYRQFRGVAEEAYGVTAKGALASRV